MAALFLKNSENLSTKLFAASEKKYFIKWKIPLKNPPSLKKRYEIVNENPDKNHKKSNTNSKLLMANFDKGILIAMSVSTAK